LGVSDQHVAAIGFADVRVTLSNIDIHGAIRPGTILIHAEDTNTRIGDLIRTRLMFMEPTSPAPQRDPILPRQRLPWIPDPPERLILTLLAKEPDDRYQSATGLVHDLHRLRLAVAAREPLDHIRLCDHDPPLSPRPPRRLHGRESELATLMASFMEVCEGGSQMLFVGGYAGVGKTALILNLVRRLAGPEQPLVLFLDDLHWADRSTLDLIDVLLDATPIPGLLLIGAYRDNEVDATHPLVRWRAQPSAATRTLMLTDLEHATLTRLVAEMLCLPDDEARPLAAPALHQDRFRAAEHYAFATNGPDTLVRLGDQPLFAFTFFSALAAQLDIGVRLTDLETEVEAALSFARKIGNRHGEQVFLTYQELGQALKTGAWPDDPARPAALEHNPTARCYFHLHRALAALLLDDEPAMIQHAEAAVALTHYIQGKYPTALANLLHSLALTARLRQTPTETPSDLRQRLALNQDWLAARAADAPMNFAHLYDLVEAERLDALGEHWTAIRTLERAMRLAEAHQRPWQRAFITERAGRLHMHHGLEYSGRALLTRAYRFYLDWGASGKAETMRRNWPFVAIPERPTEIARASSEALERTAEHRAAEALALDQARQALARLEHERELHDQQERFIDLVAHEYRTPLAIMQTNLDILKLSQDPAHWRKGLINMELAIKRLAEVFDGLLRRGDWEGQCAMRRESIDLAAWLEQRIAETRAGWPASAPEIRLRMREPARIRTDPALLKTVLLNLLDNARKYGPAVEPIQVELWVEDTRVRLSVDNACSTELAREPLDLLARSVRGPNSQGIPGLGLGLHLVDRLVGDLGGEVELRRDRPGRFEVRLSFQSDPFPD
jgi:signal transduction histidine kinase